MRILIVDDETRFAAILARALGAEGYADVASASSAEDALDGLRERPCDLLVTDLRLPGMSGIELMGAVRRASPTTDVVLMTAFADVATARDALKRGAIDYLVKPFDNSELVALAARTRARLGAVAPDSGTLEMAGMVGSSPTMQRLFSELARVARADASVLILGESGTGKELLAHAVHSLSARAGGPFIEVNTATLPESVIESELFGHERGAFTGADKRKDGLFELAAGGTVFLDEIGELPLALQPKLLRFLQERRFYRVGGTKPVTVDARVVAATNRDLAAEAAAGRFREDLYYRLDVASLTLPPLRERHEDVPLLVQRYLRGKSTAQPAISVEALAVIAAYRWPGNIRELHNAIERAVILADGATIGLEHLPDRLTSNAVTQRIVAPQRGASLDVAERERALIERALAEAAGNKTRAAELLGMTRRRLYSRLKLLGMGVNDDDE
ncbi:MAG TPA: sigma-54 dependent transcriptional regulator [Planctomycetota bacterium]|nr:sigma-54 dependent transcriptional regulator [Planctomycetota bacterium]